jgi:uncharacterized protein YuzE
MLKKFKIDYDVENDSLFMYRGKSRGSIELGNILFDFDAKNELAGVEILNASSMLQALNVAKDVKISKRLLQKIANCSIDIRSQNGLLVLKIYIVLENKEQIIAPIQIPTIVEHSPLAAET